MHQGAPLRGLLSAFHDLADGSNSNTMSTEKPSVKFICPCCASEHERGYLDGVATFRCLRCGYTGHGFHADTAVDRGLFEEHEAANTWAQERGLTEERPFESWEPGRSVIRHALGRSP